MNNEIVREAWSWQGVKYQHRGTTQYGCDCTGLIIGVLQELGYLKNYNLRWYPIDWNLHNMADNYIIEELEKYADKVTDPKAGDVIVFNFGKCPAHAGIILDDKVFIHSFVTAGRCILSPLNSQKWRKRIHSYYRFSLDKINE